MKIEWKPKQGRAGVLTLFLDGEPCIDVDRKVFGKKPELPKGCESPEEVQENIYGKHYSLGRQYAIKRLSMQSLHSEQLAKILREHLICEEAIQQILSDCTRLGFLNDVEWVNSFVRIQKSRGLGSKKILAKLKFKGISSNECEGLDQGNERELLLKLLTSKYSKKNLLDFRERQKVIASLVRKGFAFSEIYTQINQLLKDVHSK